MSDAALQFAVQFLEFFMPHKRTSFPQPRRRQNWAGKSRLEILAGYPPGQTHPLVVLNVLIDLYNKQHTALAKSVPFKTREQRGRFFRGLPTVTRLRLPPDPAVLASVMCGAWYNTGRRWV